MLMCLRARLVFVAAGFIIDWPVMQAVATHTYFIVQNSRDHVLVGRLIVRGSAWAQVLVGRHVERLL